MRFDFVDLRLFVATIDSGSLSAGARSVNLSLPAASARISGMEEVLQARLLERSSTGVTPTEAGVTLLQHARIITEQHHKMRGEMRGYSRGLKGTIRVLSNTAGLVEIIPAALGVYMREHPDVEIRVEERISTEIASALRESRADLGIAADTAELDGLETKEIGRDHLCALVSRLHPLADASGIALADLVDEPIIGLSSGALFEHLSQKAAEMGARLRPRVLLRSFEAIIRLVERQAGVSVVTRAAARGYDTSAIAVVPLSDAWAPRVLNVCYVDWEKLSVSARAFANELLRQSEAPGARAL